MTIPKSINHLKGVMITVAALLLFSACGDDNTLKYSVDAPLQPYFDRFAEEAALRNVVIDYDVLMISGDIRLITSQNVIGQCGHSEEEPTVVIVDKFYWDGANDLEREFLIFHELGHCALNRGHIDDSDAFGDCVSIMTSGTGSCNINYTLTTREELLDELFSQ